MPTIEDAALSGSDIAVVNVSVHYGALNVEKDRYLLD
jgi:hypothetical protein